VITRVRTGQAVCIVGPGRHSPSCTNPRLYHGGDPVWSNTMVSAAHQSLVSACSSQPSLADTSVTSSGNRAHVPVQSLQTKSCLPPIISAGSCPKATQSNRGQTPKTCLSLNFRLVLIFVLPWPDHFVWADGSWPNRIFVSCQHLQRTPLQSWQRDGRGPPLAPGRQLVGTLEMNRLQHANRRSFSKDGLRRSRVY